MCKEISRAMETSRLPIGTDMGSHRKAESKSLTEALRGWCCGARDA